MPRRGFLITSAGRIQPSHKKLRLFRVRFAWARFSSRSKTPTRCPPSELRLPLIPVIAGRPKHTAFLFLVVASLSLDPRMTPSKQDNAKNRVPSTPSRSSVLMSNPNRQNFEPHVDALLLDTVGSSKTSTVWLHQTAVAEWSPA